MNCAICNTSDLFTEVSGERACSTCVIGFRLSTPVTPEAIRHLRTKLKLEEGQYLRYDHALVAAEILQRSPKR